MVPLKVPQPDPQLIEKAAVQSMVWLKAVQVQENGVSQLESVITFEEITSSPSG